MDSHPFFPLHVVSGQCFLTAHAARLCSCCGGHFTVFAENSPQHSDGPPHVVCVRPSCSTPPRVVLVVCHLPPRVAMCAWPNYSTSPCGAGGHCTQFHGFYGCRAHLRGSHTPLRLMWVSCAPPWWQGSFAPHYVRADALGSSHPSFVPGSFPFLTTLKNRAAGVPSVALRVPHPLRADISTRRLSPPPLGAGAAVVRCPTWWQEQALPCHAACRTGVRCLPHVWCMGYYLRGQWPIQVVDAYVKGWEGG